MKVSLNWLKELVEIKMTPEDLAERMALSFVEVNEIIKYSDLYKSVFVGEIKEIKKHPNADNLSVAKVQIGKKRIQIIIGQGLILPVGTKFPVVVAPAELPSGMLIEKRSIRGIESQGMIGSNKDLGFDWSKDEIFFFKKEVKSGTPIVKVLGLNDVILDLDILSNRPDLFSHLGVAREISAVTGSKLKKYNWGELKENNSKKINNFLEVEVKDKKLCPRYEARVIENIKILDSPDWLKNRLVSVGIRPVNNVVDITNYVMIETGQPMHAFDFSKLSGSKKKKIIVRKSKIGEEIITLDDKKRRLPKNTLLIADNEKPIGIAGVMGGLNTEVTEKTKTIVLESANFSWPSIRKTSRLLGLRSEAVNRFEKGLDPNMTSLALDRAAYLISKIANGEIISGKIDENFSNYSGNKIEVSINKISRILGFNVEKKDALSALKSLGMEALIKGDFIQINIPSYRMDIKEDVDVIEDIARIIGYDKIPISVPKGSLIPPKKNLFLEKEKIIKDILKGFGLSEVYTYTFIGEELIKSFDDNVSNYFELKNPLTPDQAFLRKNLIYSLSQCAIENSKNFDKLGIFEFSKVFLGDDKNIEERKKVGIALLNGDSFFDVKGIIESLFEYLNIKNFSFDEMDDSYSYIHPRKSSFIKIKGKEIGFIGELHPQILSKMDTNKTITVCQLDFDSLVKFSEDKIYKNYSKFPAINFDLSFILDERIPEKKIKDTIKKEAGEFFDNLELFDIYKGSQINVGEKSLAYHLSFRSNDKTLTEEEVMPYYEKIIAKLKKDFGAILRG